MLYIISILIYLTFSAADFQDAQEVGTVFSGLSLITALVTQLCKYYYQSNDIENIQECKENIEVFKKQADDLLEEVRMYLFNKFPDQEREIFKMITANTPDILAVAYPEIKSDEVFMKGVRDIQHYKDSIYNYERRINTLRKKIRVRANTILLTSLPILPKEK